MSKQEKLVGDYVFIMKKFDAGLSILDFYNKRDAIVEELKRLKVGTYKCKQGSVKIFKKKINSKTYKAVTYKKAA